MNAFTVKWNPNTDETAIEFTPEYNDLYLDAKIDILKDVHYMVQQELEQKVISIRKELK